MRLGTRWRVGDDPPASLPPAIRDAVQATQQRLTNINPAWGASSWTLTWLEGRAVCVLHGPGAHGEQTFTVREQADGSAQVLDGALAQPHSPYVPDEDDDSWLVG